MKTLKASRPIDKVTYERELGKLRLPILDSHFLLRETRASVVVIVAGADGAGKGEVVRSLAEWLDPRGVDTHIFETPGDQDRRRAPYSQVWQALPARGRAAILFGSWHGTAVLQHISGAIDECGFVRLLERIRRFENMLLEDGVMFLKVWLHLSKKELKRRIQDLSKNPKRHLRFLPVGWKHLKHHRELIEAARTMLRGTDAPRAPWHVIQADDDRSRNLAVARLLLGTLRRATAGARGESKAGRSKPGRTAGRRAGPSSASAGATSAAEDPLRDWKPRPGGVLAKVDLTQRLPVEEYQKRLEKFRGKLAKLAWRLFDRGRSVLLVFEGWDAAGKGGAIRRVTQALDPRLYRVVGFAAPTPEEKAHHYLWRFWRNLPRPGTILVYDRSHYGRVLVERVEGFAKEAEWRRAYGEINDFEEQLVESGVMVCKFWLHVSPGEQIRRFHDRERVASKRYKITEEDWRNRAKWPLYEDAVEEMVARTGTEIAPWNLVAANDKRFARIDVLRTICRHLGDTMEED